jgi:dihydroorotase
VAALQDGTLDAIATDHAPHSQEEKSLPLPQAPFGIIGLETAVPLCLTQLVHTGLLPLPQLIALFTCGPRRVLNLAAGALTPGAAADLTVLDVNRETVIDPARFHSRSRNTPFAGWRCKGKAVATVIGGWWIYCDMPPLISSVPQENLRLLS